MTNAEIPVGRQAVRPWKRLDAGVRKDVWRRSRRGVGHPDPAVAAIAVGRARYSLGRSVSVRYWSVILIMAAAGEGLLAAVDRVTRIDRLFYVLVITTPLTSAAFPYAQLRRDAKQMEEANMNTFRAGHADHGSRD